MAGPVRPDFCPYVYEDYTVEPIREVSYSQKVLSTIQGATLAFMGFYSVVINFALLAAIFTAVYFRNKYLKMKQVWVQDSFTEDEVLLHK
jgi:large-conductance mechanosensitive channel